MASSESHNIGAHTSSVPSVKRKVKLSFESSIQGHSKSSLLVPEHRQQSRTVCRRNVQLTPTIFLKRTKI